MEPLAGQEDWTQLVYCRVHYRDGRLSASRLTGAGRLQTMAAANVLVEIGEGRATIGKGDLAEAWFFND